MQEMQETQVQFLGREDPLEEKIAPTPAFLVENSYGQRSLVGTVHGVRKSQTGLSNQAHGPIYEMSIRGKSVETKT